MAIENYGFFNKKCDFSFHFSKVKCFFFRSHAKLKNVVSWLISKNWDLSLSNSKSREYFSVELFFFSSKFCLCECVSLSSDLVVLFFYRVRRFEWNSMNTVLCNGFHTKLNSSRFHFTWLRWRWRKKSRRNSLFRYISFIVGNSFFSVEFYCCFVHGGLVSNSMAIWCAVFTLLYVIVCRCVAL